jgi:1,3-beta-glucanosyltransferase GAS5
MTGVYSGGLVYEYSMEPNKYGLVEISGDSVSELDDFTALMDAFKGTANPQGDGGYNSTGGASGCPAYNPPNWDVQDDSLPAIPQGAMKFMTDGAGSGPGLSGPGSQNAGGESTGTATAGSGQPTRSGSTGSSSGTSSSAASGYIAPTELSIVHFAAGAVVVLSSLFGAALL